MPKPVGLGFVGCGRIAGPYAQNVVRHPDKLKIVGAYDLVPQAAHEFTAKFGGVTFDSVDALLGSPDVEAVVNLTIHTAHAEVTRRALEAGKHVHSEKPLATNRAQAAALVELAEKKRLLLGCSPFVILGEAQQTLWKAVRDGMIGLPLEATGHILHGRVEKRNPSADAFLGPGAGPTLDVGCYPLNVLTSIFGPVRRVRGASADVLIPDRVFGAGPRQGQSFKVSVPDHATGLLQFATSLPGRLTASFTIGAATLPGIEIYGTEGSLTMTNSFLFNAEVKFRGADDKDWRPVPHVSPPFAGVDWSRGLLDMFEALRHGTPLHCTGRQALHILDICLTILECAEEGRAKDLTTTFTPSPPVCP